MAHQDRGQAPDIKKKLLLENRRFSFIQALRLLRLIACKEKGEMPDEQEFRRRIQVRPELSLDFPGTDLTAIEEILEDPERFVMTVTFLGLYGSSSPLPTFYTEDLLWEHAEGLSITRDFLDIINFPLYPIFFRIWSKYRLFFKIVEDPDPDTIQRLYCLLGFESEKMRERVVDPYGMLRYLGLTTQAPRSAEGLRAMLSDHLHEPTIDIEQCVPRVATIPDDQRFILGRSGCTLGDDAYLGSEVHERMGKFRVKIGPVDSETFHRFLPDKPAFKRMAELIRFYLDQPLIWDMEIRLKPGEIQPVRLGDGQWTQVGWNTCVFSNSEVTGEETVVKVWAPGSKVNLVEELSDIEAQEGFLHRRRPEFSDVLDASAIEKM